MFVGGYLHRDRAMAGRLSSLQAPGRPVMDSDTLIGFAHDEWAIFRFSHRKLFSRSHALSSYKAECKSSSCHTYFKPPITFLLHIHSQPIIVTATLFLRRLELRPNIFWRACVWQAPVNYSR